MIVIKGKIRGSVKSFQRVLVNFGIVVVNNRNGSECLGSSLKESVENSVNGNVQHCTEYSPVIQSCRKGS